MLNPLHWPGRLFATAFLMTTPALFAQWGAYPTAGVPRTPDGKPNLTAPTPKTAEGKPDFTGIWQNDRTVGGTVAARNGPTPPASNEDLLAVARRSPFWNLGSQFKDGLPFTPWGAEIHRQRAAGAGYIDSESPTTAKTIRTRIACRWGSCNFTITANRAR